MPRKMKILFFISAIVMGLALVYFAYQFGCDSPQVQNHLSDYNDVRPKFRITQEDDTYYIEFFAHDSTEWNRCEIGFATKGIAQDVINECEQTCLDKYNRLTRPK